MFPKIVIHNSISLDGSLTNFEPNMDLHYKIAGIYKAEAHLIGSNTAKVGVALYGNGIPQEEKKDYVKAKRDKNLPYWVMIDTKGALRGILHICRRFEFSRDIIILLSEETPKEYIEYLRERNYNYHIVGKSHVNLREALKILATQYGVKTVLTDTGRILGNLLLNQGLVSEISLLIHPLIVGKDAYPILSDVNNTLHLTLQNKETLDKGYVWLVYKVNTKNSDIS
jgi:2,5-diamino-6-(ribosylamino)-4(3H)-pyrimidinone 5'-phosphate reductase